MADINYGSDPQNFARALEQMKALEDATRELDQRERQLRESERGAESAIIDTTSAMDKAIANTRDLARLTGTLTSELTAQVAVLREGASLWERQATAMSQASRAAQRGASSGRASAARTTSTAAAEAEAARPPAPEPRRYLALPAAGETSQGRAGFGRAIRLPSATPETVLRPPGGTPQAAGLADQAQAAQRAQEASAQAAQRAQVAAEQQARATAESAAASQQEALAARESAQALAQLQERKQAVAAMSEEQAAAQMRVNLAYNESIATYAGASTALSRNGALTTEFIQAFARGDVTLQEFSSQMTNTIGKFGGWAIAAAAVYGVVDALNKLREGATQTQEGVTQLSRFIPSAGGGAGRTQAEDTFRNISTQFNVPINEVTSSMSVMARVFHSVAGAGEATRAVLLANRLDQIPVEQAQNYMTGLAQALPDPRRGGPMTPQGLVDTVSGLNQLQNQFGARVNQTLPGVARAAPAAQAAGVSDDMLMALVGLGVRGGISGNQVGTALLRSMSTFAWTPQSQATFRGFGIHAQQGQYGSLIEQIQQRITNPAPGHELTMPQVQALAQALGGPQLGGRTLLPILEHINLLPGMQAAAQRGVTQPQTAFEELGHVLGGIGEQARRLGITLENVGSELASAGLLQPIQVFLQTVGLAGSALEHVLSPLQVFGQVLSQLPGPIKDLIGVLAAVGAARVVANSSWGFASQQAIGRLPGLGFLRDNARSETQGVVARYRTFELPQSEREYEKATLRTRRAREGATAAAEDEGVAAARATANPSEANTNRLAEAQATRMDAEAAAERAAAAEAQIGDRIVQQKALIAALTGDELTAQQKLVLIEQQQLAVADRTLRNMEGRVADARSAMVAGAKAGGPLGTNEPTIVGGQPASQAFNEMRPEEQAAVIGATAATENPQAFATAAASGNLAQAEEQAIGNVGFRASPAAAALRNAPGAALGALQSRMWRTGTGGAGMAGALGSALENPLPLLIGSGLAGAMLPGAAGSAVSTIGTAAGLGAMGTQMFGGALGAGAARTLGALGYAGAEEGATAMLANPLLGAGAALTAVGATRHGGVGLGAAVAGGAMLGTVIGGPVGTVIGAGLGAGLHFLTAGGGDSNQLSAAARARDRQATNLRVQIAGGTANWGAVSDWGSVFSGMLQGAFDNGNQQQAQKQQQAVEQSVRQQAQLLRETGITTTTGRQTAALLEQGMGAAATAPSFAKDPYDIGQIIDTSGTALLQASNTNFQYRLSQAGTNRQAQRALYGDVWNIDQFQRGVDRQIAPLQGDIAGARWDVGWYQRQRAQAQQQLAAPGLTGQQQTRLRQQLATFNRGITSEQSRAAQLTGQLRTGRDAERQFSIQGIEQAQQDASAVLSQIVQRISDVANLASAAAGGNRMAAIQAQITGAQQTFRAAQQDRSLSPAERQSRMAQARVATLQGQLQAAQQRGTEIQAQGAVAASTIPSYEPVQQAQQALRNATTYYNYVRTALLPNGRPAFDPADVRNALAAQNQTAAALADANYQWQTGLVSAQAQLGQAQNPASAAGQARWQIWQGNQMLALARNRPERLAARALQAQGAAALRQAQQSTTQTTYQITEAQQQGDPVAQAMTAISAARTALAQALGPDQVVQARLQMAQAEQQLHQATLAQITATGDLRASETNNVLQQDARRLAAARQALATAIRGHYGRQVVGQQQTQVNQLVLQQQNDYVSQRLSTIQYQQQTLQISAQGALQELQALSRLRTLTVAQRQQIGQEMYAIETNQQNTSLFDLAPAGSNIRVPTIYDIRTAAAREHTRLRARHDVGGATGSVQIGGATVNTTSGALHTTDSAVLQELRQMHRTLGNGVNSNATGATVNVYVASAADTPAVYDAIDRTLGTRVRARLRSAGARGT